MSNHVQVSRMWLGIPMHIQSYNHIPARRVVIGIVCVLAYPITSWPGALWLRSSVTTRLAGMWLGMPKRNNLNHIPPSWDVIGYAKTHTISVTSRFFLLLVHDSIILACHVTVKWRDTQDIAYPYVYSYHSTCTVLLPKVFCVQCMREMESMSLVLGFDHSITALRATHVRLRFHDLTLVLVHDSIPTRQILDEDGGEWPWLYQII